MFQKPETPLLSQDMLVRLVLLAGAAYLLWSWLPLLALLSTLLVVYYSRHHGYWRARGVPYLRPTLLLGNLGDLLRVRVSPGQFLADMYNQAPGERFVGYFIFDRPSLLIRDTELIKNILVKDFDFFPTRHTESHYSVDPVGARNLFVVKGERWRHVRAKLTAAFTSGKMKNLFQLVSKHGADLGDYLEELSADAVKAIRIRDIVARSSTDVITSCMFGIESNTLRNPRAEFRMYGKKVFGFTKYRAIEILGLFFVPALAKIGRFQFFQKETTAFFRKVFGEAMEYRSQTGAQRNDLLDAIIKLGNNAKRSCEETNRVKPQNGSNTTQFDFAEEDLVAQAAIFFSAGFETTSITINFALYELAVNQHIQVKLREEIVKVVEQHDGQLTYDAVCQMKYLDMVVSETLRKYPPLPYLDRICLRDYKIPHSHVTLEKGTPVYISALGIHRDPRYFPDPLRFDPERFSEDGKRSRPACCYMPFGQGPHNCIGMRFGLLSAKVSLAHVLSRFEVQPSEETPVPLQLSPFALFLSCVGAIPLTLNRLAQH